MPLDIKIQNQIHTDIERYGDGREVLSGLCQKAPRGTLLSGVDPYGDTMFNAVQLDQLIEEIDAIAVELPSEREALSTLRAAADTAIRKRGYLYFVGD